MNTVHIKNRDLARGGFNLIELMIAIAIISLLISLAAWSFLRIRSRIRTTSCRENMKVIHRAALSLQTERADLDGENLTVRKLMDLRYLRTRPVCPSGGKYWIQGEDQNLRVTCKETTDGDDHGYIE